MLAYRARHYLLFLYFTSFQVNFWFIVDIGSLSGATVVGHIIEPNSKMHVLKGFF